MELPLTDLVRRMNPELACQDGHEELLISILTYDFEDPQRHAETTFLILPKDKKVQPGAPALGLLAKAEMVDDHTSQFGPDSLTVTHAKKSFASAVELAKAQYEKRVLGGLLSGKCKILLLLNSGGGQGIAMRRFGNAAKANQKRGGAVGTFATTHAQSAAGLLLFAGDKAKRYVLGESLIMLHAPHWGDPEETAADAEGKLDTETATEELRNLLHRETAPKSWPVVEGHLQRAIKSKKALLNEVRFTGKQLVEYGLVESAVPDVQGLVACFERETGLAIQLGQIDDPISEFFSLSAADLDCLRETGVRMQAFFKKKLDVEICSAPVIDPKVTDARVKKAISSFSPAERRDWLGEEVMNEAGVAVRR